MKIPMYHKIWWEGDIRHGMATMRLMAFNGKENIVLERHENVQVVIREEEKPEESS